MDAGPDPAVVAGLSARGHARSFALGLILGCAVVAATGATAAEGPRSAGPRWEIVPTVGAQGGGGDVRAVPLAGTADLTVGPVWGLAVARALRTDTAVEATWLHHETGFDTVGAAPGGGTFGLDVDAVHVGGVYRPVSRRRARPFVSASLGLTRYDAEPAGFDSATRVSLAVGGGWTVPSSKRTAVRFTVRGWLAFDDAALAGTCGAGECSVVLASDGAFRLEGTVGLVLFAGR